MIIYFSATGNNKYLAERVSAETGDSLASISECIKNNRYKLSLVDGEDLGIITPTYFWGLPSIVIDFFEKAEITYGDGADAHYVYHITTFGEATGNSNSDIGRLLKKKGFGGINAGFCVRMVDTWTPMFDLSDKEKNIAKTAAAEPMLSDVIEKIKAKSHGDFNRHKGIVPLIPILRIEYEKKRNTSNFTVSENCIGCGLCASQCPLSAIEIRDKKATFVKEKCTACLGCLHRCPKFAIQYGKNTAKHGQFVNPNVKL